MAHDCHAQKLTFFLKTHPKVQVSGFFVFHNHAGSIYQQRGTTQLTIWHRSFADAAVKVVTVGPNLEKSGPWEECLWGYQLHSGWQTARPSGERTGTGK